MDQQPALINRTTHHVLVGVLLAASVVLVPWGILLIMDESRIAPVPFGVLAMLSGGITLGVLALRWRSWREIDV
ncbi:MAG: hypothetical protein JWQ43_1544 [Glaciihabitans sp.]|nr:hypothetical protein [Glaciihabitans sp.]